MYKLVVAVIAGMLIGVPGSVPAQTPMKVVAADRMQAARQEQKGNENAGRLRTAGQEEAFRNQPPPSPRNAAFIVFLSLVYGRK